MSKLQCLVIALDDVENSLPLLKVLSHQAAANFKAPLDHPINFSFDITNKYFTANVCTCFCTAAQLKEMKTDELQLMEAIIVSQKLTTDSSFTEVKEIISSLESLSGDSVKDIETCLLYSSVEDTVLTDELRNDVFAWCIDKNFELVEANGDEDSTDDGFEEKFGVDRVLEALNSHIWSNHIRNDEKSEQHVTNDDMKALEDAKQSLMNGASFDELFSKFAEMKEKAKTLEGDDRKDYAEKVATAFMEALGIDDSDDEDANK